MARTKTEKISEHSGLHLWEVELDHEMMAEDKLQIVTKTRNIGEARAKAQAVSKAHCHNREIYKIEYSGTIDA